MKIFNSRRFMLLLLDTTMTITLHFAVGADAQFVIGALQPVFLALIVAYTAEDVAEIRSGLRG